MVNLLSSSLSAFLRQRAAAQRFHNPRRSSFRLRSFRPLSPARLLLPLPIPARFFSNPTFQILQPLCRVKSGNLAIRARVAVAWLVKPCRDALLWRA
ncbi:hypothetical protein MUK42_14705 [Musa troglodytarum]|uniref:Uncharacterized protein n=1 Tax=Musa troglodytarum TaxID=320322 RepID=A0A9E7KW27_9LILI|nr:hypothetical protein MUK42_14705 [Musa troglodytarum]